MVLARVMVWGLLCCPVGFLNGKLGDLAKRTIPVWGNIYTDSLIWISQWGYHIAIQRILLTQSWFISFLFCTQHDPDQMRSALPNWESWRDTGIRCRHTLVLSKHACQRCRWALGLNWNHTQIKCKTFKRFQEQRKVDGEAQLCSETAATG